MPVARVKVKNLVAEFDTLRTLLSPWQAWFFQKRRLLRLIDKVLDHEINMSRLEELRRDVNRRLVDKRSVVLRNFQQMAPLKKSGDDAAERLSSADTRELIDLHFFLPNSVRNLKTISQNLVARAKPGAFDILFSAFPEQPRDTNDTYWASALHFLLTLNASGKVADMFPGFLGPLRAEAKVKSASENLIRLCLSTFDGNAARKSVLQYSACARRVAKILLVTGSAIFDLGKTMHLLVRNTVDELDISQFLSSPERHNLLNLDQVQYQMTARFCLQCQDDQNRFQTERAKQRLKELWRTEHLLLGDGVSYRTGLVAANLGEIHPTEAAWVVSDALGHACLCVIGEFPEWVDFVMAQHRSDVERLARHRSWKARELLGIKREEAHPHLTAEECAHHFFDGDQMLCRSLVAGYGLASFLRS